MKDIVFDISYNCNNETQPIAIIRLESEQMINYIVDNCEIRTILNLVKKRLIYNASEENQDEYSRIQNQRDLKEFLNLLKELD